MDTNPVPLILLLTTSYIAPCYTDPKTTYPLLNINYYLFEAVLSRYAYTHLVFLQIHTYTLYPLYCNKYE